MRAFAKVSAVKAGDFLRTDGGFTCMRRNAHKMVCEDINGLFISCSSGAHYLNGQVEGEEYVGLYKD